MKPIHLSETKLNQLAQEISNRLFGSHYFNQDVITGEALNHFCDHDQINKFLLFQVYQVWQLQMSRFKHPYFNFEHEEVTQLLAQLQNLLSRNIALKKEDFKPLLFKAVLNNLRLLTNPREAFQQFFFQNQDKISLEMYEKYNPFFSDFDFVINAIRKYYQKNNIRQVEKDVFLLKFDRVLELYNKKSEQNDDTYRSLRFFKLTNRRLDEVIKEDQEETAQRKMLEKEEAEKQRLAALKRIKEEKEKAEEEKRRKMEALRAEEEEQKRNQRSFFDEIPASDASILDLGDEDLEESEKQNMGEESNSDSASEIETIQDQVGGKEEPFWKKLQSETETSPTQAERLKESNQARQKSTLMDRFNQKQEAENPPSSHTETTPTEAPQTELPKVEPTQPQEEEKSTATLFNKIAEEAEQKVEKPSVLDAADKSENKPASLVDLLQSKDKGKEKDTEKEEKKAKEEKTTESNGGTGSLLDRFRQQTKATPTQTPISASKQDQPKTLAEKLKESATGTDSKPVAPSTSGPIGEAVKPDEIPIHKQYRFVQKVFGGNNVRFRIIVDKINNAKSSREVEEILDKYVFNNADVNRDDETVQEFIQLMRGQ